MGKKKTHNEYVAEVAIINPDIEVIGQYLGGHISILHKCKIDGCEWMAMPSNILRGRGCPKCKALKLHNLKVKTHEQYVNEVHDINPNILVFEKYAGRKRAILHMCLVDGTVWYATPNHVLEGYGCPTCSSKKVSAYRTKTHEDYVKEVWNINPYIEVVGKYVNSETKILHRCLIDGHEWFSLPGGILGGHGCPHCNQSIGERRISIYLDRHNVKYKTQHTFDDCRYKKCLPFDFYLTDYNVCVEYDGEQHFKVVNHFGGENGLLERQRNDLIKTNYCLSSNINLLRIRYDQNVEEVLDAFFNNIKLTEEAV